MVRMDTRSVAVLVVVLVNAVSLEVARAADPPPAPAQTGSAPAGSAQTQAPTEPPAPAQALFTIAGADRILLRREAADQRSAAYTLAILPAPGIELDRWMPSVIAAVRDGSVRIVSPDAVKPQLVPGDGTHPALLRLTVDFAQLHGPGTYELTIGFFAKPAAGSGRNAPAPPPGSGSDAPPRAGPAPAGPAPVVVKLVVPAAQLRAPAKVHIDRFLPLFGAAEDSPAQITLYETGRDTPVALSIERDGALTSDDHPIGVDLVIGDPPGAGRKPAPLAILAGKSSPVVIRVAGELPVGTSRGSLLITADELATSTSVPIEIRTRRTTWWIPLVFGIGAVLGLGWRYASQRRKQQLEKQARMQDLLEQIAQIERDYPAIWRTDLTDLMTARDKLVRWTDPPDDALTAAEQALTAAIATRATKRANVLARIAEAREATLPSRVLPASLDLVPVARGFQAAYERAIAGELTKAIDLGTDVSQRLSVLVAAAKAWASGLKATLDAVKDGVPGCPRQARDPAKTAIATAIDSAGKVGAVSQEDVVAKDAPVRPRLDALQTARLDADVVAAILVEGLEAGDEAIARLGAAVPDAARQRIHEAARVALHPGRPERTIAEAINACARLAAEVGAAVDAAHPGTRPPEVAALLAAGDYSTALAWRPASKAPGNQTAFRRDIDLAFVPATNGSAIARRMSFDLDVPGVEAVLPRFVPTDPPLRRTAAAIRRELAWWVRVGWVISAVVASITVWAIYSGSFVGTRVELFGLFTTGFATDLATGSKLEELIGKIKLPGSGSAG